MLMLQKNLRAAGELIDETTEDHLGALGALVDRGVIQGTELERIVLESEGSLRRIEKSLKDQGVPKHEILLCLSGHYSIPFVEFSERLAAPGEILERLDRSELKRDLWFPISVTSKEARVAISNPADPLLIAKIKADLGRDALRLIFALPTDIIRMVEHSLDVNPGFPADAGRTPLARLRTRLASERTKMSRYRTTMARGRTGLAAIRTGVKLIAISLTLLRIFGIGWLSAIETVVLLAGIFMVAEGISWYMPMRSLEPKGIGYVPARSTFGTTIPEIKSTEVGTVLTRSEPVKGAEELRNRWSRLSPVMRRRFFAIDRSDLAEERTLLAMYRTRMARSRTGLAFASTGTSVVGFGILLWRNYPVGAWSVFYAGLIMTGVLMFLEGARWYFPGRRAVVDSIKTTKQIEESTSIWDFMFRAFSRLDDLPPKLTLKSSYAAGLWGTTGLALERTLLAERRNVKARLRTTLARSRTAMRFIRTGVSIFSVGFGLLVYFGWGNTLWNIFDFVLIIAGLFMTFEGFFWYIKAERRKKQLPYCWEGLEIRIPDYAKPSQLWKKVVFNYEDNECGG
jgi:uncharacterized membrane protein YidH (DUF202 family)